MSLIRYLTKLLTYISTDKQSLTEGKNYIPIWISIQKHHVILILRKFDVLPCISYIFLNHETRKESR